MLCAFTFVLRGHLYLAGAESHCFVLSCWLHVALQNINNI